MATMQMGVMVTITPGNGDHYHRTFLLLSILSLSKMPHPNKQMTETVTVIEVRARTGSTTCRNQRKHRSKE